MYINLNGLVGWLDAFHAKLNLIGYLMTNSLLFKYAVLFQTIQFTMSTQFNCLKKFLFQALQFIQIIQVIQFCISIDFVYTQLTVKTVLY